MTERWIEPIKRHEAMGRGASPTDCVNDSQSVIGAERGGVGPLDQPWSRCSDFELSTVLGFGSDGNCSRSSQGWHRLHEPYPKQVKLPQNLHPIIPKYGINRCYGQIFHFGLSNQHTVKWVPVWPWQLTGSCGVFQRDREALKA